MEITDFQVKEEQDQNFTKHFSEFKGVSFSAGEGGSGGRASDRYYEGGGGGGVFVNGQGPLAQSGFCCRTKINVASGGSSYGAGGGGGIYYRVVELCNGGDCANGFEFLECV